MSKIRYHNSVRQKFLLTFFTKKIGYEEKFINGFWLVKKWNGGVFQWQVAIYTKESFEKYRTFGDACRDNQKLDSEFEQIIRA